MLAQIITQQNTKNNNKNSTVSRYYTFVNLHTKQ